jgi:hypothetical protein
MLFSFVQWCDQSMAMAITCFYMFICTCIYAVSLLRIVGHGKGGLRSAGKIWVKKSMENGEPRYDLLRAFLIIHRLIVQIPCSTFLSSWSVYQEIEESVA